MLFTVGFILSSLFLTGCNTTPTTAEKVEQKQKSTRMTLVTSGKPADVLPAFTTFTWSDEYTRVLSAISDTTEKEIQEYLRNEIIINLNKKGYVYQPDPVKADVVIGFLFALEDDLADQKIQDKFGLLPGISSRKVSNARYEKGSLLLAVLDTDLDRVYWRSAMQGFVDFERDRVNDKTKHLQMVLGQMLSGFPEAGK